MDGRKWCLLADKTLQFIAIAKECNFCTDILAMIRRRLFWLSPFPHHNEKGGKY